MSTSLEQLIYDADDLDGEIIEVPEWGGVKLQLRSPDALTRTELVRGWTADEGAIMSDLWPALIIACTYVPDTDEHVFQAEDAIERLQHKNGAVIERIGAKCQKLMGIGAEEAEEGKGGSS